MKLFTLMIFAMSAMGAQAFATETVDCRNIVQDGNKNVNCAQLSGAQRTTCEAGTARTAQQPAQAVRAN